MTTGGSDFGSDGFGTAGGEAGELDDVDILGVGGGGRELDAVGIGEGSVGSDDEARASDARTSRESVARYYDRNTARFLLMGRGGVYAMHRELWAAGVRTAREAADQVNRLIADELADLAAADALVLDFGCGVGGTLFRLAESLPRARFHGVTISERQRAIAARLATRSPASSRCTFSRGDFHAMRFGETAEAIVAVESFAHSDAPAAFLANASRHLAPGGRLVLVDDFLARDEGGLDEAGRDLVARFRRGWRVPGIATVPRLEREADAHGLAAERSVDLTPRTRPGTRLRDRLIAFANPALERFDRDGGLSSMPFFGNLIGGHALQVGLSEGILEYRLLVFRKVA